MKEFSIAENEINSHNPSSKKKQLEIKFNKKIQKREGEKREIKRGKKLAHLPLTRWTILRCNCSLHVTLDENRLKKTLGEKRKIDKEREGENERGRKRGREGLKKRVSRGKEGRKRTGGEMAMRIEWSTGRTRSRPLAQLM